MQHVKLKARCRRGLNALLLLEDGTLIEGCGFGAPGLKVGEVVFTTSMVGYPESLTDPSYEGQILVITYPLVGNYGVPGRELKLCGIPLHYESDKIHVEGLIVAEETDPSHWASTMSLHEWLKAEGIPGMSCVDTRFLVKKLRTKGVMMGVLKVFSQQEKCSIEELSEILAKTPRYDNLNLVERVSPRKIIVHQPHRESKKLVAIIDCGVKYGILRELLSRGYKIVRFPYNCSVDEIMSWKPCGVVVSNGPGNPAILGDTIEAVKALVEYGVPLMGICLGHQIIALSQEAEVYKLKYGHRGANKPCMNLETGRCYVTSQNHGFAVSGETAEKACFKIWFINVDDKSVEGLKHKDKPILTVQFHPEASPGPPDTSWIFDIFDRLVIRYGVS